MITKKIPVALFVVAALIAGSALLRKDPIPDAAAVPLPDPQVMLANGHGYRSLEEVAATWRARVRQNPDDYLSRTRLGRTLLALARETGDLSLYGRAEAHLRTASAAAANDVSAATGLAASLSAQHEFTDALDRLREIRAEWPDDPSIQAAIADAHIDLGQYQTAFAAIDDLARAFPGTAATLSRQARVAALTGHDDQAVELSAQALVVTANIGVRPSDAASSWFQMAFFQHQAGSVDLAEQSLRSGLSIDPRHLPSRELLGKVLVAQGRLDRAADLYEDILEVTPAADLHGLLAEVYEAQGRDEDATEQNRLGTQVADQQVGRFPAERRHLASFFADTDPERFLELMEQDVATRRDVYGLDLLAWAQFLNGDEDAALETSRDAMRLGTEDAPMLFHAGMIELAAGDESTGRGLLERALAVNPGFDLRDVAAAEDALAD